MKRRNLRRATLVSMEQETGEDITFADKIADWKPNPEQLYSKTELKEILRRALTALAPTYRVVFLLRDVEGLSTAETAELLGLSESNVKARLFRARLKLRERLSPYFERDNDSRESSLHLK